MDICSTAYGLCGYCFLTGSHFSDPQSNGGSSIARGWFAGGRNINDNFNFPGYAVLGIELQSKSLRAWEEILAQMESSFSEVRDCALSTTDQELDDPQRIPWREGRPLWRMLVGSAVEHPLLHLGYYHIGKGNLAEAARLQETLASRLLELDASPAWRGVQVYNLACIRALSGQKDIALANLAEALQLAPELMEWSKQDPDLAGLRGDPAFEAIYAV